MRVPRFPVGVARDLLDAGYTSGPIYGAALVGGGTAATTKGNAAGGGTLYNISAFSTGSKPMASSDVLKVTVTLTIQDV
jgi:hypothetical protein